MEKTPVAGIYAGTIGFHLINGVVTGAIGGAIIGLIIKAVK